VGSPVFVAGKTTRDILMSDRSWTASPETEVTPRGIAKTRLVWMLRSLPTSHHEADLILVPSSG
jgi:hypothetical protein